MVTMPGKCTTSLLASLRTLMRNGTRAPEPLQAFVVPWADAHNSEYLAECDMQRAFLSGFTGSAGTVIVTEKSACLWTDGRYYLQAELELDSNWTLMKESVTDTPTQAKWLCTQLPRGSVVGADPALVAHNAWRSLAEQIAIVGHRLVPVDGGLVELLWPDRPPRPAHTVRVLSEKYTGRTTANKLIDIRRAMRESAANALIITALDEVAWTLNLRGSDIRYNPVFFAYMMITSDSVKLYIDATRLPDEVHAHLAADGVRVEIQPYGDVLEGVRSIAANKAVVWFGTGASRALTRAVENAGGIVLVRPSPVALLKAIKNATEIEGMRASHVRDSAALCRYLAWLEERIQAGDSVTEVSGAAELERFRAQTSGDLYVGLSFETISAAGPNAAIVHYRPSTEAGGTDALITGDALYLCDSGAQYLDGTTDVTRTVLLGGKQAVSSAEFKRQSECFTRVLRGQLRLGGARFPRGILGNRLDTLARQYLWDVGLDYQHGTGHGVGHYLCVHEGPMGVTWRPCPDDPGLQAGMFLSNEPGYYETNNFGIRLENVVLVVESRDVPGYLEMETVTLVPIQTVMIDRAMLDEKEVSTLNKYHQKCAEQLEPVLLKLGDQRALDWLRRETSPI